MAQIRKKFFRPMKPIRRWFILDKEGDLLNDIAYCKRSWADASNRLYRFSGRVIKVEMREASK